MPGLFSLLGWSRRIRPPQVEEPAPEPKAAPPVAAAQARRSMLFIDEPNVARSLGPVRANGHDLDYRKLKDYFSQGVPLAGAFFYTGYDEMQVGMRAFFAKLTGMGYEVVTVPTKRFRDGTVKNGDPDIKIITDMFTRFNDYDEAILVSGDGDFADTARHLMLRGKRVVVVAMRSRLAQDLRECGADVIFLESILPALLMERRMRSTPISRQPSRSNS